MLPSAFALAALLLLLLGGNTGSEAFTLCNKHMSNALGISSLELTPERPQNGEDLLITVKGVAATPITVQSPLLDVELRLFGVALAKQQIDICAYVSCPLEVGDAYEFTLTQPLPYAMPTKLKAKIKLSSGGKTCVESASFTATDNSKWLLGNARPLEFVFQQWKQMHPRAKHNLDVFRANWERIVKHNADPSTTFKMGMNEFGSMTTEEFIKARMGVRRRNTKPTAHNKARVSLRSDPKLADPPTDIDWTELGKVTRVKNQGSCGSCWAFSAVGAVESAYAIKTGELVELSEQEMVSCDSVDSACDGGWMNDAFEWARKQETKGGLCSEASYPYVSGTTRSRGVCEQSECQVIQGSSPSGFEEISTNEASLLAAVASHGPVSVAIQADQYAFQFYSSGVMTGQCGSNLDHGVLLVGYGTDERTGLKFWKVKNSWGERWGESGYIRLQRDKGPELGQCGIAAATSYPVFE